MHRRGLSRRTVLRGLGTALALPLLDAMAPRGVRAAEAGPLRLAFLYVPNGIDMPSWTPPAEGALATLPPILEPLEGLREDVLVLSGLAHDKARANGDGPGDHARASAAFLTGCQPKKTAGADIRAGISVDQAAARARGGETSLPSLELGLEPARQAGGCDSGYSCAYSSSIAWASPHTPLGKEIRPRLAFDRLFTFGGPGETARAATRRRLARKSILDFVREDAVRLRGRVGGADRQKLGEYFDAVRQLERRIDRTEAARAASLSERPPPGVPRDYARHARLLLDVLALAFRADLTRVATFMFANEGSNRSYAFLGAKGGHHQISHHGGDERKIAHIRAINRFHVTLLASFLRSLEGAAEGEGSVLDNCLVVYGSGIADGNRHDHHDLPVLLAGRGGGTIRPGRHVRHRRDTPACNLYLSLLDRFGVELPTFGDSTGRLPSL